MYLLKRGIDAVSSATTSTRTRLVQLEAKASATQTDLNKQQAIATEMIKIAPTSLKGYLLAGRTHLKQKNYEVALAVYKQGLELVPNIVPSYSLLQRNYDAVQAELMKRQKLQRLPSSARNHHQQQQKHQDAINQQHLDTVSSTFAYDIISLIFSHLSVHDLIKCTSVCDSWRRFIIKWPVFWQLITAEIPQLDLNSFTMYLTNRHRGLKFLEQQHPHTHRQKVISRNALSLLVALQSFRYPLESLCM
ncbi:hypothetical protein BDB00DRAFT_424907 [Zychaea mexicana]|uniref:uncharacterized protein n=1 Tax=Zychaea mexicana TaxID=64656 RepID=UPI0022FE7FD1|nr:uncharacterized protein BDB00DRAFT_424907 [Zychaea mexicana]KAI9492607.1 hypothetical protein BDB00DRAFT_424907 [Zychaea mexicana]